MEVVYQLILAIVFSSIIVVWSFTRAGQNASVAHEIIFSSVLITFGSSVFYMSTLGPGFQGLFTFGMLFFSIGLGIAYKHIHLWMTAKDDKAKSAEPKKA